MSKARAKPGPADEPAITSTSESGESVEAEPPVGLPSLAGRVEQSGKVAGGPANPNSLFAPFVPGADAKFAMTIPY